MKKCLYEVTFEAFRNDVYQTVVNGRNHEKAIALARVDAVKDNKGVDVGPIDRVEYKGEVIIKVGEGPHRKRRNRKG